MLQWKYLFETVAAKLSGKNSHRPSHFSYKKPLELLLIGFLPPGSAGATIDHFKAFSRYSRHRVWELDNFGGLPPQLNLARFDGIILHYSIIISNDNYLAPSSRERIRNFQGFKAVFIQDDYRWINRTVNACRYMGLHAIFGLASQDIIDQVYCPKKLPGVRRETTLTGFVPPTLVKMQVPPLADRPMDVVYRARKLPAWIGEHTLQKWVIGERFKEDAKQYDLHCDISNREEDRIYGDKWIEFISTAKAVLGTESGASVCDFTGEIQENVERHEKTHPDTPFAELQHLYFKDVDGKILMNVISPRCFEAAALRTLMILYPGEYFGILVPWRHYVPLEKDHSNMAAVVALLRDLDRAQTIVDNAYREVAQNPAYHYSALAAHLDRVIAESFQPQMARSAMAYNHVFFYLDTVFPEKWIIFKNHVHLVNNQITNYYYKTKHYFYCVRHQTKHIILNVLPGLLPKSVRKALKPIFSPLLSWIEERRNSRLNT